MFMSEFLSYRLYRANAESKGVPLRNDSDNNKTAKKYMRRIAGKTLSQFDQEYWSYIIELISMAVQYTPQERNEIVTDITEYYFSKTGLNCPNAMCVALADFLLDDILGDPDCFKSQRAEYPILSHLQFKKRSEKEIGVEGDTLEFLANEQKHPRNKRITQEK